MRYYFIHGLNHTKDYPPVLEFQQRFEEITGHNLILLEIPGYEKGDPFPRQLLSVCRTLAGEIESQSVVLGHSFGGLLLAYISTMVSLHKAFFLAPWFRTYTVNRALNFDPLVRKAALELIKRLLLILPAEHFPDVFAIPGSKRFDDMTDKESTYRHYYLRSEYPVRFLKEVLLLQANLHTLQPKNPEMKTYQVLSTNDTVIDNEAVVYLRWEQTLLFIQGKHQICYDQPGVVIELLKPYLND